MCFVFVISSVYIGFFFFSSRRRHTRCYRDWSSDVCSSDLASSLGSVSRSAESYSEAVEPIAQLADGGNAPVRTELNAMQLLEEPDRSLGAGLVQQRGGLDADPARLRDLPRRDVAGGQPGQMERPVTNAGRVEHRQ